MAITLEIFFVGLIVFDSQGELMELLSDFPSILTFETHWSILVSVFGMHLLGRVRLGPIMWLVSWQ